MQAALPGWLLSVGHNHWHLHNVCAWAAMHSRITFIQLYLCVPQTVVAFIAWPTWCWSCMALCFGHAWYCTIIHAQHATRGSW
jgi:hypothetical protein